MSELPPIKERIEMAIVEAFAAYLATHGVVLTELRAGAANALEPDACAMADGRPCGIEVVDVWYSKADAASAMGLVRRLEKSGERGRAWGAGFDPDYYKHPSGDPFIGAVEAALISHSQKTYGGHTWLLLNALGSRAPFHGAADGPRVAAAVRKPAQFSYVDAYLALTDAGRAEFFRVQ